MWKFRLSLLGLFLGLSAITARANTPSVSIVSPIPNSTEYSKSVTVKLAVPADFQIVDYLTYPKAVSGQGHFHLWLDAEELSKSSAIKLTKDTYTFENIREGNHTLTVELVGNDHSSLYPRVTSTVSFRTSHTAPETSASKTRYTLQILVFTIIIIIGALYFTNLHLKNLKSNHTKKASTPKPKSKSKPKKTK